MKQQSIDEVLAADKALVKAWDLLNKAQVRELKRNHGESDVENIGSGMSKILDAREEISATVQEPENSLG